MEILLMRMSFWIAIAHTEVYKHMSNLTLDRSLFQAKINGRDILMSEIEFEILWLLSGHSGRSITINRLAQHLEEHDLHISSDDILSNLITLKEKIPQPRRLGLLGSRAMLI